MKKILALVMTCAIGMTMFLGCSGNGQGAASDAAAADNKAKSDTITMVWYPNESGGDLEDARNEIGAIIEKAIQ